MTRRELVTALRRGEVVLVLGTGVTASLTKGEATSTWIGLLRDGVERLKAADPSGAALLEMRLESAKDPAALTTIAQDLRRDLGDDFGRWIARTVGKLALADDRIAKVIAELNAPVLTTNYDDLVERAIGVPTVTWRNPDEMRRILMKHSKGIGHLHGAWSQLDSVVFSQSDYQQIINDEAAQNVQRSIFTMKRVLFIGVGRGHEDPNFGPTLDAFSEQFQSTSSPHFRLCRDSEVDPSTELKSVVDLGYGTSHDELFDYLLTLSMESRGGGVPELRAHSGNQLVEILREKSTLWRDAETLSEKTVGELVVDPIFLPEPHDQYATSSVLGSDRQKPALIVVDDLLRGKGTVIVAGEENSGVSTAVIWMLARAMTLDPDSHTVLVDRPMMAGKDPVGRQIERFYRTAGLDGAQTVSQSGVLGIDNLRFEEGDRFAKAIRGTAAAKHGIKIVGVRESDALDIANALREEGETEPTVVYLGRFSKEEVRELARRVAPGREEQVAKYVMIVIREKNLPRTPFTATLLVELVQSGVKLKRGESEIAVLDQYLDLLLSADFLRARESAEMTLRNKRLVLELLARRFVERKEDTAPQSQVIEWLSEQFGELGWTYDALGCINDLIERRVLARGPESTIRFQRSAYLELMAGIAAKGDESFRSMVLGSPLQLASIVRTYAAMARNDSRVLEVMNLELDRIARKPPAGSVFSSVRQIQAVGDDVFSSEPKKVQESSDQAKVEESGNAIEKPREPYYDDSDDSDAPAFLTTRIEELSEARVAMLVVDLASRVLRDSDEIRNQTYKALILEKVLAAWVQFTDLYEAEISESPDVAEVLRAFFPGEHSADELEEFRQLLVRLYPSIVAASGIRYCLSGPALVKRLSEIELETPELGSFSALMRTTALYFSGGTEWVDSLRKIDDLAVRTFYSASFLASLARYAYVVDDRLADDQRARIRDFLRRVVAARYRFDDPEHKNRALNTFEDKLRKSALNESLKRKNRVAIQVDP